MDRYALGIEGEKLAEQYLVKHGLKIIARRWRTGHAEIDLIAIDGKEVVFVEVKARRSSFYGSPEESITRKKRDELRFAAATFMSDRQWRGFAYRIDVVAIEFGVTQNQVRHLPSAVEAEG